MHRVYLQVNCKLEILTPFQDISKSITNQVVLMENVILGRVPDTYYDLDGLNPESDALEIYLKQVIKI